MLPFLDLKKPTTFMIIPLIKKTRALAKRTNAINAAANAEPSCVPEGSVTLEIFKNIVPIVNPKTGTSTAIMIPDIHKGILLFLCR